MIVATVKADKVQINLKKLNFFAITAPRKRLLDIGFEILRLSQEQVPHDKGSLQNSGNVETLGDTVIVGYHKPYAARLHEHPEYNFQGGRKGKYLEDPINTNMKVFKEHLKNGLSSDIRSTLNG